MEVYRKTFGYQERVLKYPEIIRCQPRKTAVRSQTESVGLKNYDPVLILLSGGDLAIRGTASRLANSNWNPDNRQLDVNADDADNANDNLGCRPSRSSIVSIAMAAVFYPAIDHFAVFYQPVFKVDVGFELN
ncbi:MAG: hypothetical protein WC517_04420 [Patescibacteria group bacterium]